MRLGRTLRVVLIACTLLIAVTGCGVGTRSDVHGVVSRFQEALDAKDGEGACALLSSSAQEELRSSTGKRCEVAVIQELSGLRGSFDVGVYGPHAWAHAGLQALFLARYSVGWRITAVDCTRQGYRLYDCDLQGS